MPAGASALGPPCAGPVPPASAASESACRTLAGGSAAITPATSAGRDPSLGSGGDDRSRDLAAGRCGVVPALPGNDQVGAAQRRVKPADPAQFRGARRDAAPPRPRRGRIRRRRLLPPRQRLAPRQAARPAWSALPREPPPGAGPRPSAGRTPRPRRADPSSGASTSVRQVTPPSGSGRSPVRSTAASSARKPPPGGSSLPGGIEEARPERRERAGPAIRAGRAAKRDDDCGGTRLQRAPDQVAHSGASGPAADQDRPATAARWFGRVPPPPFGRAAPASSCQRTRRAARGRWPDASGRPATPRRAPPACPRRRRPAEHSSPHRLAVPDRQPAASAAAASVAPMVPLNESGATTIRIQISRGRSGPGAAFRHPAGSGGLPGALPPAPLAGDAAAAPAGP